MADTCRSGEKVVIGLGGVARQPVGCVSPLQLDSSAVAEQGCYFLLLTRIKPVNKMGIGETWSSHRDESAQPYAQSSCPAQTVESTGGEKTPVGAKRSSICVAG